MSLQIPLTHPKLSASLFLTAILLLATGRLCSAQTSAQTSVQTAIPELATASVATPTSTSLPDAPEPQNSPTSGPVLPPKPAPITFLGTPKRILLDQKAIWTSPLHLKPVDAMWLLPLGAVTGTLIGSDQHTMNDLIHINANDQKHFKTLSDAGVAAIGALPASMYLWSLNHYAPQARETGLLSGEALVDSLAFSEAIQLVTLRDRPSVNHAKGSFFSSKPLDGSFPSNHSAAAWSMAAVLGDEYPGWLMRTTVYGLATTVSVSRVLAEQHFPSDVLIGSAAGWLIGHYVYRAHHNYTLNPFDTKPMPRDYGVPRPQPAPPTQQSSPNQPSIAAQQSTSIQQSTTNLQPPPVRRPPPEPLSDDIDPDTIGSTNVPMDSWIYPALERLGAMGFIPGQSSAIRPWTREECRRQLRVAEDLDNLKDTYSPSLLAEAHRLMTDLRTELEGPQYRESLSLESVYARYGTIAGPALQDSFHFGQTWWNDFGRPLGRGSSAIAGFSFRAHNGRFFLYDRQELQHSPGNPAETPAMNQLFNVIDRSQPDSDPMIAPKAAKAAFDHQGAIELYAGVAFAGNALSLGKQELYWGPTTMGPIAFSSNAEPTYNLRFVSTRPHPFPLFPSLGTYRFDIVLGKLSGHSYPARPWYNGQKADFNFGDNLEISFTRWSIFWGVGHPITFHSFKANVFSFSSTGGGPGGGGGSLGYGDRQDPGDRKSNFDFTYRLPFLRRLVTLYADAYSDDDPNPISAPRRAVWNPGIYFARLPFLPHMDLRVEAVSSHGLFTDFGPYHFFTNSQYLDGNTNKGFLLGNAIGRDARAIEGRTGYWFSARTRVEAGYRQNKIANGFLPSGGTVTDGFVNASYAINRHWQAQLFTQYERFLIPSYMAGSQHNSSGWLQLTWYPELHLHR
ncbi:MAG TPA: capsule assembly Wzi family protein [Edaphobacter sp.]|nr:capsule assembly Wzi family protein [Edaphobacter sp.]